MIDEVVTGMKLAFITHVTATLGEFFVNSETLLEGRPLLSLYVCDQNLPLDLKGFGFIVSTSV